MQVMLWCNCVLEMYKRRAREDPTCNLEVERDDVDRRACRGVRACYWCNLFDPMDYMYKDTMDLSKKSTYEHVPVVQPRNEEFPYNVYLDVLNPCSSN